MSNSKICTVADCGSNHRVSAGLCNKHYLRNKRNKSLLEKSHHELSIKERLNRFIEIDPDSGCWIWIGSKNRKGYGQISFKNRTTISHRLTYSTYIGVIPSGMHVLHRCDRPSCNNPDHLFLGSDLDNSNDKILKKRDVHASGEFNGNSKLKNNDVIEIKKMIIKGISSIEIARLFGVSGANIRYIRSNFTWRHLNECAG